MAQWAQTIVDCLKESDISFITFVPDVNIGQIVPLMEEDSYFHVVYAAREEEAVGIAVGAYAAGRKSAVFMQSSGFGNSINAVASLCLPFRTPIPFFINMRGDLGEFNIAQVPMGKATRPILDMFGLPHYTITQEEGLDRTVKGAMQLCYASRQPVALCLTPLLHGGKIA